MSTVPMITKSGPGNFKPAEFLTGGQVVEARANGKIGPAGAGSLKTLGVTVIDAMDGDAFTGLPTMVNGRPVLMAALASRVASVAYGGIEVPVIYAAPAAFGDRLMAASNGRVTPVTAADVDPRAIVGICTQPGGVASANLVGNMRTA